MPTWNSSTVLNLLRSWLVPEALSDASRHGLWNRLTKLALDSKTATLVETNAATTGSPACPDAGGQRGT
jgi:hypothetical protein